MSLVLRITLAFKQEKDKFEKQVSERLKISYLVTLLLFVFFAFSKVLYHSDVVHIRF